ncbi:MAG TPA: hypothetical protein VKT32_01500, partial [Chthonomonadaceae bacterium]|nr:hypothetical protein [Chthonomonadaceae bacterium]
MQLGWENTLDDLVAFNKYHYKHSPRLRRRRIVLLSIVTIWLFFMFASTLGMEHLDLALLYTVGTFVVGTLFGLCLRWLIGDRLIRSAYSGEKNRAFLGAHEMEVT